MGSLVIDSCNARLRPDTLCDQLRAGGFRPAAVGRRVGRAGMQDFTDAQRHALKRSSGAGFGKAADTDDPRRCQGRDDFAQVRITSGIERRGFRVR